MRSWKRIPADTLCGRCTNIAAKGDAGLYIKLPGVQRELLRCKNCAGCEAPPDLPPLRDYAQNEKEIGDFAALQSAMPKRTRGDLRKFVERNFYEVDRE